MKTNVMVQQIWALLERIDAALVTRDPGSARSAEAYDGLRKQVNQASKNRRIHVSHLLSLSDSIQRGAEYQLVKDRVSDFLIELGVSHTSDVSRADFFEVTGGTGDFLVCTAPAVIETLDDGTISLVRLGQAERTTVESSSSIPAASVQSSSKDEVVTSSTGMKVAIGITIAIVGFFFGWVIASTVQDDSAAPVESPAHVVSAELSAS